MSLDTRAEPNNESSLPVHIVRITQDKGQRTVAHSPTLSESQLAQLADAGATWRDAKFQVKRMREIGPRLQIPGLVFLYTHPSKSQNIASVPAPLTVNFEPVELLETEPQLQQLLSLVDSTASGAKSEFAPKTINRWMLRTGLPIAVLLQFVIQGSRVIIHHGWRSSWSITIIGLLALTILLIAVFRFGTSGRWFMVPGAVVERRSFLKRVGVVLRMFTPADSVVVVRPEQHGWVVMFKQGDLSVSKRVTKMELAAFLAAWQSPMCAPDLDLVRQVLG